MREASYYRDISQKIIDQKKLDFWNEYKDSIFEEIEKNAAAGYQSCELGIDNVFKDILVLSSKFRELCGVSQNLKELGFRVNYKFPKNLETYNEPMSVYW